MRTKRRSGFTIVELLIVIVVIAILASITIVAYNGMQARAQAAKYLSDAKTIAQKATLYKTLSGTYPPGTPWGGSIAYDGYEETKLPDDLRAFPIYYGDASDYAVALSYVEGTADGLSPAVPTYGTVTCSDGEGMIVYYIDPAKKTIEDITLGTVDPDTCG